MAHQPRLVNKQFNSPIGLYSQQNVQEVLDRDMQILTNGGVGINFYDPNAGKPANLHNSAVLRMIEEEKRHHNGSMKREGTKRIAWPPVENEDEEGVHTQRSLTPCHIPHKVKEPPPSTITLRPQAPVSQASPPVFTSQPATATLKGGKCLRGDLKWPPESVKKQSEEENRLRMEIAKGPVCRPRKVRKDYTGFFAQHALNSTYPGYKAPPGTQYYGESDY